MKVSIYSEYQFFYTSLRMMLPDKAKRKNSVPDSFNLSHLMRVVLGNELY